MSPTSGSMGGYPYGSSSGYAGAMYAAAASSTSNTKDSNTSFSSSLMAAGDSINSLRLKAKQHSTSSSPTAGIGSAGTSYYPAASVSPGKSNSSDSPSLIAAAAASAQAQTASDLYNNSSTSASAVGLIASGSITSNANSEAV